MALRSPTTTSIGYVPGVRPAGTCNTADSAPEMGVVMLGRLEIWSFSELGGPKYRCVIFVLAGKPLPLMVIQVPAEPAVGLTYMEAIS